MLSIINFNNETGPSLKSKASLGEVQAAIAKLDINDIFNSRGTIVRDVRGWRIDIQNSSGTYINISVQRNYIHSPSTVASVMVPCRLRPDLSNDSIVRNARTGELSRAIKRGLLESLETQTNGPTGWVINRKVVTGSFSA